MLCLASAHRAQSKAASHTLKLCKLVAHNIAVRHLATAPAFTRPSLTIHYQHVTCRLCCALAIASNNSSSLEIAHVWHCRTVHHSSSWQPILLSAHKHWPAPDLSPYGVELTFPLPGHLLHILQHVAAARGGVVHPHIPLLKHTD